MWPESTISSRMNSTRRSSTLGILSFLPIEVLELVAVAGCCLFVALDVAVGFLAMPVKLLGLADAVGRRAPVRLVLLDVGLAVGCFGLMLLLDAEVLGADGLLLETSTRRTDLLFAGILLGVSTDAFDDEGCKDLRRSWRTLSILSLSCCIRGDACSIGKAIEFG